MQCDVLGDGTVACPKSWLPVSGKFSRLRGIPYTGSTAYEIYSKQGLPYTGYTVYGYVPCIAGMCSVIRQ